MARFSSALIALVLVFADVASEGVATTEMGQEMTQLAKLTAADGSQGDDFGYSVAISSDGSRVAMGSYLHDVHGSNSGAVYLFDGNGTQLAKLTAEDGTPEDMFGHSVAISSDGSRVAVGAIGAYLFDGYGTQLAKLTPVDGASNDYFGRSVAISADGSRIVVGAPFDDDNGTSSGSVYIFDGTGTQLTKLIPADNVQSDIFGWSVAISPDGDRILVGAPRDDDKETNSGSVYMFDGMGTQLMKLTAADGSYNSRFGSLVVMSSDGNRVAVGTLRDSVYIFDGAGTQLMKLTADGGVSASTSSSDWFGESVAMNSDGSRIAIGAPRDDDKGSDSGAVYIFDGSGTQVTKLIAADTAPGDNFGKTVAMTADGNQLAVGADFDNDMGSYSGSVYLFELPPATSTNTETLTSTLTSTTETSLTTEESSTATVTATETTTLTSSTETSLTESSTATETTTPHATTEISATDLIVESSGCDRGAACTLLAAIAAAVIASLVL